MKSRIRMMAVASMLTLVIAWPLSAAAFTPPDAEGLRGPHGGPHGRGEIDPVKRFIFENMAADVIAQLSGQPVDTIRQKLEAEHPRELMAEYGIDRQAFQTAMRSKETAFIQKLEELGYLTSAQVKEIQERMNLRVERRGLMEKLVENGVASGAITAEEAKTLMHPPH